MTLAPVLGVFAFAYDGIFIGATWARDMRNLMVLSLLIFPRRLAGAAAFGNAGLWGALLVHYAARGGLQALRYPALRAETSFGWRCNGEMRLPLPLGEGRGEGLRSTGLEAPSPESLTQIDLSRMGAGEGGG